jgi:hypothetical protein
VNTVFQIILLSRMIKRGIERFEIEHVIMKGEVIEEYPDDK